MDIKYTHENNMDLMSRYPDKHFDWAILDPEYGIGADKPSRKNATVTQKNGKITPVRSNDYIAKNWDSNPADNIFFDEVIRVSKNQIIFGINYFNYEFISSGRLVWDKLNGESDQFGVEIAYISNNNRTDIVYYLWAGFMQGIYAGKDVKKALTQQGNKKLNEIRIHPTQKPVPLYKYLLNTYCKNGDLILDTNHGSGSLSIACIDLGFDIIACENDEDYFNTSSLRINRHLNQQQIKF